MDQLAALRAFVRIVETGSFSRAAASLGTPKPTVSKLIQQLEHHLQAKLLTRTTRRLAVTSDGAAYYERALRLLADLDELDASVAASQTRPKGKLRIEVSSGLAQSVIIPALGRFFAAYPDIQLDIRMSDQLADLVSDNVDCVIRGGVLTDLSLIARRIGEAGMTTCAAPAYLDAHGMPDHPDALARDHLTVGYLKQRLAEPHPMTFQRGNETLTVVGRYQAAVNEGAAYIVAALQGYGIVQAPTVMVRPHLDSGALRPVLPDWTVPAIPLHVVYPPNRHLSTRLRVFVDWTAALFAETALSSLPAAVPAPRTARRPAERTTERTAGAPMPLPA